MEPVTTTLLLALPDRVPNRLLAITATFADPPRRLPINAIEKSVKNPPPPARNNARPNSMNANTMPNTTLEIMPRILFVSV